MDRTDKENEINSIILQSLISVGETTEAKLCTLISSIKSLNECETNVEDGSDLTVELLERIENINKLLVSASLEIQRVKNQKNGEFFYFLVSSNTQSNKTADDISAFFTTFTAPQVHFIKVLLDIQFGDHDLFQYNILGFQSIQALNAVKKIKGLTQSQAEDFLIELQRRRWLTFINSYQIYKFSDRAITDLLPYLRKKYGENLKYCTGCTKIFTKGICCPNHPCGAKFHNSCAKIYLATSSRCPLCQKHWDYTAPSNIQDS